MVERGDKTSYELKKQLYKKWLKDPTPQNKEQYQSARDACKHVIKQAKEKAWSEYGNQLEDMRKTEAMKSFYKKVKSMRERDQPYCPITTIKYAQGQIITDKHQIKQRWGGYFEGSLNPNEDTRDNFSAQDILEHEPEILRSEIEESLKLSKTGKAPGIDNKSSRKSRCRTAVESMQSSLERWNSTDGVETVHNNTYIMEKERTQKRMLSV